MKAYLSVILFDAHQTKAELIELVKHHCFVAKAFKPIVRTFTFSNDGFLLLKGPQQSMTESTP